MATMTIYQKVITAYEMLRRAISSRMSKYDVASEFNELSTYDEGKLVIYQDEIFICKKRHTGAWNADDFQRTTFGEAILYNVGKTEDSIMEKISDEFDEETSYSAGQIVRRGGKLYRCTTAHTGPWDANDFTLSTVNEALDLKASTSSLSYKADMSNLARPFSSEETYHVDQLVVYNNTLFRCTTIHKGDWNEDHFTESTVGDAIEYYGNYSNIEIPGGGTINIGAVPNGCVRTVRIYESGESAPGAHLSVALPSTEPEFEDFSVYNARLVIDTLDLYNETLAPTISFGSQADGDFICTPSGSEQLHISSGCLNVFDISFCGWDGSFGKLWIVRMLEASVQ